MGECMRGMGRGKGNCVCRCWAENLSVRVRVGGGCDWSRAVACDLCDVCVDVVSLSLPLSLSISLPPLACCWQLWNICIDKLYAVSAHKPQNVDNNSKREGREWGENRQNSKYFDVTKPNWAWQGEHHMLLLNRMQQRLLSISSPFFHLVPPHYPIPSGFSVFLPRHSNILDVSQLENRFSVIIELCCSC